MMRGTMCINQCIVKGWLFRSKLVKGKNSESYTLINNEFRDVVYQKTQVHFNCLMKISLRLYQAMQATSED